MKKKTLGLFLVLSLAYIIYSHNYSFNVGECVRHAEQHALPKSHTCCAWFVMRALQAGGCPIPIAPAYAYRKIMPMYGFKKVKGNLLYGDIVVFPAVKGHPWGHVVIWNGKQWISDFKQNSIFPALAYRQADYIVFRHEGLFLK